MGFYGNIANAAKTSMQFDRKYCNRFEMETKCSTDGVMAGRYILVEYDLSWNNDGSTNDAFTIIYTRTVNGVEEFSPAYDFSIPLFPWIDVIYRAVEIQQINPLLSSYTNKYYIGVLNDEHQYDLIIKKQNEIREELINIENKYQLHLITEQEYKLLKEQTYAKYHSALTDAGGSYLKLASNSDSNYVNNFNIDKEYYVDSRGWDSTVWTKTYDSEGNPKYVMIAELNSVVPTFNISVDAPTELPQAPHFDEADTNIFYTLHLQPNWGFRVAEEKDAIDFNLEAFEPQVYDNPQYIKKYKDGNNEITLTATGSSGFEYNDHSNKGTKKTSNDIQEMRIHLPAIGNMMSKAWDIIHGPNRDNDAANSLQGRLNFFTDGIEKDEIPVQHKGGYLVGAHMESDKWIDTNINADTKTITVNHTFTKMADATSTKDLNNSNSNTIKLYTPQVDAKGHVVGKHIETVTLPNGYSKINGDTGSTTATTPYNEITFTSDEWLTADVTENTVTYKHDYPNKKGDTTSVLDMNDTTGALDMNNITNELVLETVELDDNGHVANKNQQTVTLPYGYKTFIDDNNGSTSAKNIIDTMKIKGDDWLTAAVTKDTITYGHNYPNKIDDTTSTLDMNKTTKNELVLETVGLDDNGHVTNKNQQTVTLPYGYKTFKDGNENSTSAKNIQDTMEIKGDEWIQTTIKDNQIVLTHKSPTGTSSVNSNVALKFGEEFTINDHYFDKKGHCFETKEHTVKIPPLEFEKKDDGNVFIDLSLNEYENGKKIIANRSYIGSLTLTGYTPLSHQGDFDIKATDTLNTALSKLNYNIAINSDTLDTISGGNLILTNYQSLPDSSEVVTPLLTFAGINKSDSLNKALGKIEHWLNYRRIYVNDQLNSINNTLTNTIKQDSTFVYDSENDEKKTLPELYEIVFNLQQELEALKGSMPDPSN